MPTNEQQMKSVFPLWHVSSYKEDEEKLLGIYDSIDLAKEAQKRFEKLPGFCWDISGFCIDEYILGDDHWTEGFDTLTVIYVPVKNNESDLRVVGVVQYPVEPEYIYEIFDTQEHEGTQLLFEKGDCVRVEERQRSDGSTISVAVEKVNKPVPKGL